MNAEIIYVSLGQAGIQMSNASWELFCIEHGVSADGTFIPNGDSKLDTLERPNVFFYTSSDGQIVPRSLIADLEPSVVDEIRLGAFRQLHNPECLINGYEDAANNYARGHFTMGRALLDTALENIRRQANRCDNLQGFYFTMSLGGGTGSGFGGLLLERLSIEYGKCSKVLANIYPGPELSSVIVEPYNVALAMHSGIEHTDVNITLDNQACYHVCHENLHMQRPTYNNVNRLMAQVNSAVTCSLRFPSSLNSDLQQLQTNMVPYPRIHFPVVSYAPIACQATIDHDKITPIQLIRDVLDPSGRLISCELTEGKFMACNLQFRGAISPYEMNRAIIEIKKTDMEFVDWCPTGFKIGLSSRPPIAVPDSILANTSCNLTMLANSSAMSTVWNKLMNRYQMLHAKRAFVHWYVGEGMEESEFQDAYEDVKAIADDYTEVGKETVVDENEEKEEGTPEATPTSGENDTKETASPDLPVEEEEEEEEEASADEDEDEA